MWELSTLVSKGRIIILRYFCNAQYFRRYQEKAKHFKNYYMITLNHKTNYYNAIGIHQVLHVREQKKIYIHKKTWKLFLTTKKWFLYMNKLPFFTQEGVRYAYFHLHTNFRKCHVSVVFFYIKSERVFTLNFLLSLPIFIVLI